jgi:hypothetical protein
MLEVGRSAGLTDVERSAQLMSSLRQRAQGRTRSKLCCAREACEYKHACAACVKRLMPCHVSSVCWHVICA